MVSGQLAKTIRDVNRSRSRSVPDGKSMLESKARLDRIVARIDDGTLQKLQLFEFGAKCPKCGADFHAARRP